MLSKRGDETRGVSKQLLDGTNAHCYRENKNYPPLSIPSGALVCILDPV